MDACVLTDTGEPPRFRDNRFFCVRMARHIDHGRSTRRTSERHTPARAITGPQGIGMFRTVLSADIAVVHRNVADEDCFAQELQCPLFTADDHGPAFQQDSLDGFPTTPLKGDVEPICAGEGYVPAFQYAPEGSCPHSIQRRGQELGESERNPRLHFVGLTFVGGHLK
jgi:hypothetical protein